MLDYEDLPFPLEHSKSRGLNFQPPIMNYWLSPNLTGKVRMQTRLSLRLELQRLLGKPYYADVLH